MFKSQYAISKRLANISGYFASFMVTFVTNCPSSVILKSHYVNPAVEILLNNNLSYVLQNGLQFYWHILENMQIPSNKVNNFEAIYCTMCLLCVEMGCDELVIELLRLGLDLQVNIGQLR